MAGSTQRHRRRLVAVAALTLAIAAAGTLSASLTSASAGPRQAPTDGQLTRDFAAAAAEFDVPAELLLAVSYQLTRWEDHGGDPSIAGGYGLMHLTDVAPGDVRDEAGRGADVTVDAAAIVRDPANQRLDAAAKLLTVAPERLRTERAQNLRGGAALLAADARALSGGALPTDLAGWYPAVARFSGAKHASGANAFADDVFGTLRSGVTGTTGDGQRLTVARAAGLRAVAPAADPAASSAECPSGLNCRFIPAAYVWNDCTDPNGYGNYDPAGRPADGNRIRYIVIHDTEGSYQSAINWFQNPVSYTSSHYVIRSSDGEITRPGCPVHDRGG